ncbi:MAG: 6-carboxytetrahydropterin synthase QueD [Myxococcales bacterium]|nr:6-carboxytetrahydropterin synthase QueD [Myxococcales bacterium]MCB9708171.1 6-carboxytetrahydropterin synthase QueD [Myxococcales bacterium]
MRMEIEKTFSFEAAHRLPQVESSHKCFRLHGHSFRVTVRVRGEVDAKKGWIVDFATLGEAWQPLHALLDHQYLNEVPGLENPTSELLARFVAERIRVPQAHVSSITVHETCMASASIFL